MMDTGQTVPADLEPGCDHVASTHAVHPSAEGCEECLRDGTRWVHLRICMECGHVGCCDSSPERHSRAHWESSGHAIMRSGEPGETWGYCFADDLMLAPQH